MSILLTLFFITVSLGDHTHKIVEYAERCAAENKQAMIRSDGPYGDLSFNYRRYGSIILVGGGIGITPIMSVLRDIYEDGETKRNKPISCIKKVSLVWVMPHASEAALFLDLLNDFQQRSIDNPLLPRLNMSIHITRDDSSSAKHEDSLSESQVVYSRPDFDDVMNQCVKNKTDGSRSILVYCCGPARMVNQLWDASTKKNGKTLRVDFYHEAFEF